MPLHGVQTETPDENETAHILGHNCQQINTQTHTNFKFQAIGRRVLTLPTPHLPHPTTRKILHMYAVTSRRLTESRRKQIKVKGARELGVMNARNIGFPVPATILIYTKHLPT